MYFYLLPVVAVSTAVATAVSPSNAAQKPFGGAKTSLDFLQSTIFARDENGILNIEDPVGLKPTFQWRSFSNEEDELLYSGGTFAHLPAVDCFDPESSGTFDVAIVGHPFDLGVTYRPGARFGPSGARQGARRISPSIDNGVNPFRSWATVVDCGDIFNTPFDKHLALKQLEKGVAAITAQKAKNHTVGDAVRIINIGGDHTITLPILRALHKTWGPVAVLHFDSHLDTWDPVQIGGGLSKYTDINHGTMLHIAHEEGLLSNNSNMHLGTRCPLFEQHFDLNNDLRCGFKYIRAKQLDKLGVDKIVKRIVDTVGDQYVYLSVDIDVLDPAFAPATGTIEPGGWTTRELLEIISGLSEAGLKIVGSDVVEFTPIYDNAAETTAIAIGEIVYEILQWMVNVPVARPT
ncbi:putative agmatinase protein [Rutstroemia sp. NJR-2017a BVV2]|nr:putative agmatinase protein [Rutstroemia sp. NJR-2017a BVV2]